MIRDRKFKNRTYNHNYQFAICHHKVYFKCKQNLTTLASAVPEICLRPTKFTRSSAIDFKQILKNDKDHQRSTVRGWSTRVYNKSKMADGRRLGNR